MSVLYTTCFKALFSLSKPQHPTLKITVLNNVTLA